MRSSTAGTRLSGFRTGFSFGMEKGGGTGRSPVRVIIKTGDRKPGWLNKHSYD
jgi:hypothetical protein